MGKAAVYQPGARQDGHGVLLADIQGDGTEVTTKVILDATVDGNGYRAILITFSGIPGIMNKDSQWTTARLSLNGNTLENISLGNCGDGFEHLGFSILIFVGPRDSTATINGLAKWRTTQICRSNSFPTASDGLYHFEIKAVDDVGIPKFTREFTFTALGLY